MSGPGRGQAASEASEWWWGGGVDTVGRRGRHCANTSPLPPLTGQLARGGLHSMLRRLHPRPRPVPARRRPPNVAGQVLFGQLLDCSLQRPRSLLLPLQGLALVLQRGLTGRQPAEERLPLSSHHTDTLAKWASGPAPDTDLIVVERGLFSLQQPSHANTIVGLPLPLPPLTACSACQPQSADP